MFVRLLALALIAFSLPAERGVEARHENPLRALWVWLARPGSLMLLAVILLYRLGEGVQRLAGLADDVVTATCLATRRRPVAGRLGLTAVND